MADSPNGSDWFELFNPGAQPVSLGGLFLTDDLTQKTHSPIPASFLHRLGRRWVHAVHRRQQRQCRVRTTSISPSPPAGSSLGLFSPIRQPRLTLSPLASSNPASPKAASPTALPQFVSFTINASPGRKQFPAVPNVVVNEVLSHTDPPLEDAVEFFNPSALPGPIGGWFLSNSKLDLKKYRIPDGTVIPGHGFAVFYEYQFNPTNGSSIPFTFNSAHGDRVYLSQADASGNLTGYRAPALFGAAANGVSFGRYTNSIGQVDFVALSCTHVWRR